MFLGRLQPRHAEDGDPDGHPRAQEVAVLQRIVAQDAQHRLPGLVTGVVELRSMGGEPPPSPPTPPLPHGPRGCSGATVEKNMV